MFEQVNPSRRKLLKWTCYDGSHGKCLNPMGKKKKYIKSRSRDTRPMAMISAICFTFMSLSSQLSKEMYGLILHCSTVAGIFILKKTRVSM
jgi:hypothetical protein